MAVQIHWAGMQKTEGTITSSPVSVNAPTHDDGDLILLTANAYQNMDDGTSRFVVPTGFTLIGFATETNAADRPEVAAFYRIADNEPASYDMNRNGSGNIGCHLRAVRVTGFDEADPIDDHSEYFVTSGDSTPTHPSIDLTGAAALVAQIAANGSTFSESAPADMTLIEKETGANHVSLLADGYEEEAGATGGKTWDIGNARITAGLLIGIKEGEAAPLEVPGNVQAFAVDANTVRTTSDGSDFADGYEVEVTTWS